MGDNASLVLVLVSLDDRISPLLRSRVATSFVLVKIIVGVNLLSYAARRHSSMDARAAADAVNDFGRDPIGEGKEERVCQITCREAYH
jgi:hypothetical protein